MDDSTESMYSLMKSESHRLKTFQMNPPWPKDYVDIKKLAKAGFFYAFQGDTVHCAFCRGQVSKWDRTDDPMSEHARHFTTCPFIMGGEVGNEHLGEDPFPGPKRPRPYDVCGMYASVPPMSMQQIYSGESANRNHDYNLDQFNYNYESEILTPEAESPIQQQQQIQIPYSNHHTPAYDASSLSNFGRLSPPSSSNSSNCSQSSGSLSGICKICYGNSIELVFLPCGHSVSCLSCAQRLTTCPCCRATITTRIRTFLV